MKLFASSLLISLATFAGTASAAKICTVEVTIDGFLDGKTCKIPAGKTLEVLTGYTQCHIPVTLDADCKITFFDIDACPFENIEINSNSADDCY